MPPSSTPQATVLVVTHTNGFRHDSIGVAESTISTLGNTAGLYTTVFGRTGADVEAMLTPAYLARVDAVVFANTTGSFSAASLRSLLDWLGVGRGFVGAHSAADTFHDAPDYLDMLGGEFLTHGAIAEADVKVNDPSHPAVARLAPRFRITDELYRFTRFRPASLSVLLSLDRNPDDGVGSSGASVDLPLAWSRSYGNGRVFYTALGHRVEVWQDPRFQQHILEAIRWSLRR